MSTSIALSVAVGQIEVLRALLAQHLRSCRPGFGFLARNLAYNNVEHVGPENVRKKTEAWAAASKMLREQRPQHLDLAYGNGERNKWDLYPASDSKAPCFVHIHGGYWQRGSKEIFACLSEGPLARGWSAALCGYTLAPEASLTQITNELKSAFDWLDATAGEHGIQGPIIVPAGPQAGI